MPTSSDTTTELGARRIHFPIIEHISIDGYELYPGIDSATPGLSHEFHSGVNVIVGINGIGKTTLLLLIYRLLTGDRDLREGEELGGGQRRLTTADRSIFAVRVPDRAVNAKATLRFRLNNRTITITRSMKDLSLEVISLDTSAPPPVKLEDNEETYKLTVSRLAGIDDFFDWVLLLKYLVFYLEDRRSLVWDKWAQTEVFRILFLPEATQSSYKTLLNNALSADSSARNIQSVLTSEKKKLARLENEIAQAGPQDLKVLKAQVNGLASHLERLVSQLQTLETERQQCRDNAARLRNDAEKLSQQERELREQLLATIFPKLTDYGAFAIASIEALRGCIVCGSVDDKHLQIARDKLHDSLHCPLCNANPHQQESHVESKNADYETHKLNELVAQSSMLREDAAIADQVENTTLQKFLTAQSEKYEIEKELRVASQKLAIAEYAAGITNSNSLKDSKDRLGLLQESVQDAQDEKNAALVELKELVDQISQKVSAFKEHLIFDFHKIISNFLAEKCELTYRTAARNVGQASSPISLLFPEFHVLMTSGVFRESGTPREETSSVSESQKEFIELAFRMAVLSAVTDNAPCSMVIETPEASLDAVFIPKAGKALNEFSLNRNDHPSTIITTSNLNGSEMIPALLGILDKSGRPEDKKSERLLNLLDYAAKSAALREYASEYARELHKSLHTAP